MSASRAVHRAAPRDADVKRVNTRMASPALPAPAADAEASVVRVYETDRLWWEWLMRADRMR